MDTWELGGPECKDSGPEPCHPIATFLKGTKRAACARGHSPAGRGVVPERGWWGPGLGGMGREWGAQQGQPHRSVSDGESGQHGVMGACMSPVQDPVPLAYSAVIPLREEADVLGFQLPQRWHHLGQCGYQVASGHCASCLSGQPRAERAASERPENQAGGQSWGLSFA